MLPVDFTDREPTVRVLDLLARWEPGEAAAFGRTLADIHALPVIVPCPACGGLGIVPGSVDLRGPWDVCGPCDGWGHVEGAGA